MRKIGLDFPPAIPHTLNMNQTHHYRLMDTRTQTILASGPDRKPLQRRADRLDLKYGAVRYVVSMIIHDLATAKDSA